MWQPQDFITIKIIQLFIAVPQALYRLSDSNLIKNSRVPKSDLINLVLLSVTLKERYACVVYL